jgi:hypothetical protein
MIESVIENFTRSFFIGVVDISYFDMGGKRNIKITFNTEDDMKSSWKRAIDAYASELFLVDSENYTWMANRDYYETAMYMTATKGAMEAWSARFEQKVKEEREMEEQDDKDKE